MRIRRGHFGCLYARLADSLSLRGLVAVANPSHGLRRGLNSFAALRLWPILDLLYDWLVTRTLLLEARGSKIAAVSQSPTPIPIARAAITISPRGSTVFILPDASRMLTARMHSCCRHTILPNPPAAIRSPAAGLDMGLRAEWHRVLRT